MSEPRTPAQTAQALPELGTAALALYLQASPQASALYALACKAAGDRTSSLLRAYLRPDTMALRSAIVADDRGLFKTYGLDCLQLARMADGVLLLSDEDLQEIIQRP
jgi:hypothetical protein